MREFSRNYKILSIINFILRMLRLYMKFQWVLITSDIRTEFTKFLWFYTTLKFLMPQEIPSIIVCFKASRTLVSLLLIVIVICNEEKSQVSMRKILILKLWKQKSKKFRTKFWLNRNLFSKLLFSLLFLYTKYLMMVQKMISELVISITRITTNLTMEKFFLATFSLMSPKTACSPIKI